MESIVPCPVFKCDDLTNSISVIPSTVQVSPTTCILMFPQVHLVMATSYGTGLVFRQSTANDETKHILSQLYFSYAHTWHFMNNWVTLMHPQDIFHFVKLVLEVQQPEAEEKTDSKGLSSQSWKTYLSHPVIWNPRPIASNISSFPQIYYGQGK